MQHIPRFVEGVKLVRDQTKHELTVMQLIIFLSVAAEFPEPLTYVDLAAKAGLHEASISKYCKMMGDNFRKVQGTVVNTGYQLVQVERNPLNTRQLLVSLSKKGQKLTNQLEELLERR